MLAVTMAMANAGRSAAVTVTAPVHFFLPSGKRLVRRAIAYNSDNMSGFNGCGKRFSSDK
jgi:hypothetical protein